MTGSRSETKTLKALETIERNVAVQTKLIDDLLDVSGAASGKLRLDLRPTDLGEVIRHVVQTLFDRPLWREQFARVVETLLDDAPRPFHFRVEIEAQTPSVSAVQGSRRLLLPIRTVRTRVAIPICNSLET